MLRSDTHIEKGDGVHIHYINLDVVTKIQHELEPYDVTSLVFLLYDIPDTALQRLVFYQRVSKDVERNNLNLLFDWAVHAQSRSTWKHEFLEALAICQLYGVIRKLGLQVSSVKKHYLPENGQFSLHINPFKKALYKLSENIDSENLIKLKKALKSFNINSIMEYESCELIFLDLMSQKFISVSHDDIHIEQLAQIIEKIPTCKQYASDLREMLNRLNNKTFTCFDVESTSRDPQFDSLTQESKKDGNNRKDLEELLDPLVDLMENFKYEDWESDTRKIKLDGNIYPIKNRNRLGVCIIINQEDFYPSKQSIEENENFEPLDYRVGSRKDEELLTNCMTSFNLQVISERNLDHKQIFKFITNVMQTEVHQNDSIFMLCILSHGVMDHIYAADSVKVKVSDIQHLLDSKAAEKLNMHGHEIPKVIIIQACQCTPCESKPKVLKDGPKSDFHLNKSECLIFWATVPEYEAFRYGNYGSIFIRVLCKIIYKQAKYEHLHDIFTKVIYHVKIICTKFKIYQLPKYDSTLSKKLYLQLPE